MSFVFKKKKFFLLNSSFNEFLILLVRSFFLIDNYVNLSLVPFLWSRQEKDFSVINKVFKTHGGRG